MSVLEMCAGEASCESWQYHCISQGFPPSISQNPR